MNQNQRNDTPFDRVFHLLGLTTKHGNYQYVIYSIYLISIIRTLSGMLMAHDLDDFDSLLIELFHHGALRTHNLGHRLSSTLQSLFILWLFHRHNIGSWSSPFTTEDAMIRHLAFDTSRYEKKILHYFMFALLLASILVIIQWSYLVLYAKVSIDELANYDIDGISIIFWTLLDCVESYYTSFTCIFVCFYFQVISSTIGDKFLDIARGYGEVAKNIHKYVDRQSVDTLTRRFYTLKALHYESDSFWGYILLINYLNLVELLCMVYVIWCIDFWSSTLIVPLAFVGFLLLLYLRSASRFFAHVSARF